MDAERFPITTPYGQVPGYPLNNGWHRGEDRAMPMDTPVLVNGHEIGLSGNSGQVTGPHLHIGRFVGGHDTAPNGGGFHFGSAVVTEVSEDAVNGKFVRVQAEGASWVYLHLSRQSVGVGQELSPTAPTPPPTPATYDIIENYNPAKLVKLNKQPTYLWGMNYHFDYRKNHPVETHPQGETWAVTNRVRSEDGNEYYRRDGQVDGFHVADCDDYVYLPPAAPAPIRLATRVKLDVPVPYYATAANAQTNYKPQGTLQPQPEDYYQISTDLGMLNLSTNNMDDQGKWINPKDNRIVEQVKAEVKPPLPTPTPIPIPKPQPFTPKLPDADKASFSAFTEDRKPVKFVMEDNYNFRDLNGYSNKIVLRKLYDEVDMVGTFYHEGREWTRVFVEDSNDDLDINRWFACPTINSVSHTPYVTPHDKIYSTQKTVHEQVILDPEAPYTKAIQFGLNVDLLYDKAKKTIDGFFRRKHQK